MTFLRAHGVALVATCWIFSLAAGLAPVLAIAIGLPCILYAGRAYVGELRERQRWGPPKSRL